MKKWLSVLAIVLALVMTISGCSGSSGSKDNAQSKVDLSKLGVDFVKASKPAKSPKVALNRKDTIVIGISQFSGIFNVLFGDNSYDWYACYLMFDYNVETGFDGQPLPGVTDYKISDDGLTYTFTIKDGVKFWDGKPVTAADLEFVYYVLADPKYDGPSDISLAYIKGLDAYKNGKATTIEGIKAVDEKTLEITTDKPNGAAIWYLQVPVLQKAHYAPNFKKGDAAVVKAKNGDPMGTGQYEFVKYTAGQELDLVANKNYYKGAPKIKNVIMSVTAEGQEFQRVNIGETDIDMATVSVDNMNAAKKAGFINVYRFPTNGYGYVSLNDALPQFKDVKVRQALMYATNRAQVVEKVYGPYAKVVNIPQSNVSWSYNDEGCNKYKFDIDKAGQLLDEAGWKLNAQGKREKDGKVFAFKFTCTAGNAVTDVLAPVMKDDLAKLGIDMTIENLDWDTLYTKYTNKQLEATFLASQLTPDPGPDSSTVYKSNGSQNCFNYSNKEVDDLIDKGLNETNIDKRKAIYKDLYKVLNNDLPILFIYQRSDMWVANARIQGLELSPYREYFFDLYKATIAK